MKKLLIIIYQYFILYISYYALFIIKPKLNKNKRQFTIGLTEVCKGNIFIIQKSSSLHLSLIYLISFISMMMKKALILIIVIDLFHF